MRLLPMLVLVCLLCALPAPGLEPYIVKDINPVPESADSSPDYFAGVGSVTFFGADDGLTGRELWRSDGTPAGTYRDGLQISRPVLFAVLGDRLCFNSASPGVPLWESDGTPAGTFRVMPETLPGSEYPIDLVRAGSRVFFPAYSREDGVELWAMEEAHP
jgi:ELWxxDGT repeat protein